MSSNWRTIAAATAILCYSGICEAAATTTNLISSPNPSRYRQAITLTAAVTAGATGKVTFYDGTTILGVGSLARGQAVLTTTVLASGKRNLRAYYNGDATYSPSTSLPYISTVIAGNSAGFLPAAAYGVGLTPTSLAVGDFNGDNKDDLAVANSYDGTVSVLLGKGDGTFQPAVNYSTAGALAVSVGDFNGDGAPDLLAVGYYSISVLVGDGNGTFQAATNQTVGSGLGSPVVADFNGDGKADLAVRSNLNSNVSVLLGNGDGTFQPPANYFVGPGPTGVAVGDFNGDGLADLAVGSQYAFNVSVFLGKGDGTFQPPVPYGVGTSAGAIAAADLNGDGNEDLVITSVAGTVVVLPGKGDGTFGQPALYSVPNALAIAVEDFNGDGKPDLAVGTLMSLAEFLNNGDGTFRVSPLNYPVGGQVAAGDFNGDGKVDLAMTSPMAASVVNILLGGGAAVDLSITDSHPPPFVLGQIGATFSLTVQNSGTAASTGVVQVVDTLPRGLTATAISGAGWTCSLTTLSCTRSDSLPAQASYPPIAITVNVTTSPVGYGFFSQTATVTGGGDINPSNNNDFSQISIVPPLPSAVSALPGVGSGSSQTFAVTVSDTLGPALISFVYFQLNSVVDGPNACYVSFDNAAYAFRLLNDAGSGWLGPLAMGTSQTISNSRCTVSAIGASSYNSGSNLTVNIPLSFAVAFGGTKNTYVWAYDRLNQGSGWLTTGSWTVPGIQGCPITPSPTNVQVGSADSSGLTIAVTTNAGCTWTAVSNASWIHLVSGANGSSSGTIAYNVDPNTSPLYQNGTISLAGQPITLTQAPPVATNTEAFVRQLYLDILSRTADTASLNTWVGWINTGVYTRAQVASQFFQSQEFYGTGNYITLLYLGIMLRDPDYGGWTGWFNYLRNGYTQTDVLNQFLASQEFQSRYGNLDNTAFVTLLYNNMLNRAPDQAGLTQWVAWLNNGTYTRAQVTNYFITSQEFQLREGNRVYADMLYIGFLRRAGDPNGLDGWTNWLANGTYTLDQEVGDFITSPEYLARF